MATLTTPNLVVTSGITYPGGGTVVPVANGGTGSAYVGFTGASASEKSYALPNASSTILTSNAAVTVAQGGTNATSLTANGVLVSNSDGTAVTTVAPGTSGNVLESNGTTWASVTPSGGGSMSLLRAATGQKVNNFNSAATLDSVALSGLTALDQLLVRFVIRETAAQNTGTVQLYDGTTLIGFTSSANNNTKLTQQHIAPAPGSTTTIRFDGFTDSIGGYNNSSATITSWTGSWTLSLRVAGTGSATASAYWEWVVFKIAGQ